MAKGATGWIGFDLDGTLAQYDHDRGPDHIGEPVAPMLAFLKLLLKAGEDCRIFTARVYAPKMGDVIYEDHLRILNRQYEAIVARRAIEKYCKVHVGKVLPVTCEKDYRMKILFDDRVNQVITNTGIPVVDVLRQLAAVVKTVHKHKDKSAERYCEACKLMKFAELVA